MKENPNQNLNRHVDQSIGRKKLREYLTKCDREVIESTCSRVKKKNPNSLI